MLSSHIVDLVTILLLAALSCHATSTNGRYVCDGTLSSQYFDSVFNAEFNSSNGCVSESAPAGFLPTATFNVADLSQTAQINRAPRAVILVSGSAFAITIEGGDSSHASVVPLSISVLDVHMETNLNASAAVVSIHTPLPPHSSITIRDASFANPTLLGVQFIVLLQVSSNIDSLQIEISAVVVKSSQGVSLLGIADVVPKSAANNSLSLRDNRLTCSMVAFSACAVLHIDVPASGSNYFNFSNTTVVVTSNVVTATLNTHTNCTVAVLSSSTILLVTSSLSVRHNVLLYKASQSARPSQTVTAIAAVVHASILAQQQSTVTLESNTLSSPNDVTEMKVVQSALLIGREESIDISWLAAFSRSSILIVNNSGVVSGPFIDVDYFTVRQASSFTVSQCTIRLLQQNPDAKTFVNVVTLLHARRFDMRLSSIVTISKNNVTATLSGMGGTSASLVVVEGYVVLVTFTLVVENNTLSVEGPEYTQQEVVYRGSLHTGLVVIYARCFDEVNCGMLMLNDQGGSITLHNNHLHIANVTTRSVGLLAVHQTANTRNSEGASNSTQPLSNGLQSTNITLTNNTWNITTDLSFFAAFGMLGTSIPLDISGLGVVILFNCGALTSLSGTPTRFVIVLIMSTMHTTIMQSSVSVASGCVSIKVVNTTSSATCVVSVIALLGDNVTLKFVNTSVGWSTLDVHTRLQTIVLCGGLYLSGPVSLSNGSIRVHQSSVSVTSDNYTGILRITMLSASMGSLVVLDSNVELSELYVSATGSSEMIQTSVYVSVIDVGNTYFILNRSELVVVLSTVRLIWSCGPSANQIYVKMSMGSVTPIGSSIAVVDNLVSASLSVLHVGSHPQSTLIAQIFLFVYVDQTVVLLKANTLHIYSAVAGALVTAFGSSFSPATKNAASSLMLCVSLRINVTASSEGNTLRISGIIGNSISTQIGTHISVLATNPRNIKVVGAVVGEGCVQAIDVANQHIGFLTTYINTSLLAGLSPRCLASYIGKSSIEVLLRGSTIRAGWLQST